MLKFYPPQHKPTIIELSDIVQASDSLKVKRLSDAAISFNDSSDAPRFGFGLPSVRVGSTSSPQRLEWNNLPSGDINIQIPHAGTGVVALSFVLSSKGQAELFSRKGESDESTGSSEEEKLKVPKFEAGAKGSVEVEKSGSFKVSASRIHFYFIFILTESISLVGPPLDQKVPKTNPSLALDLGSKDPPCQLTKKRRLGRR